MSKKSKNRSLLTTILLSLTASASSIIALIFIFNATKSYSLITINSRSIALTTSILSLLAASIYMLQYLKGGRYPSISINEPSLKWRSSSVKDFADYIKISKNDYYTELSKIHREVELLKKAEDKKSVEFFTQDEKQEIVDSIKTKVINDASTDVLESLEKSIIEKNDIAEKNALIDYESSQTISRLQKEIKDLSLRGNVNLTIGMATTGVAIIILSFTVINQNVIMQQPELMHYYIPRISLSIFIEVFSFFFLRLYRTGLSEIKYYQNEITNINMKVLAAKISSTDENNTTIPNVVDSFLSTERNPRLTKSELKLETERLRQEKERIFSMLEAIKISPNAQK